MPDIFNLSAEMQTYFNSLPADIQAKLMESNLKLSSKEDLMQIAENAMKHKTTAPFEQQL